MNIEDYFQYTRRFTERLDELGVDYSEQDRKKIKMASKSKQAPSTLNTNHLPDDIDHTHRAKAAMAARANKEFMGPNDPELPDNEQTSANKRQDVLQPADKEITRPATYTCQLLQVFDQEGKPVPLYSPISSLPSERDSSSFLPTKRGLGPKPPKLRSALKIIPKPATMRHQLATL
ncbi:hypothetical protein BGZ96_006269 [Linnemannia gamsii]|uniref:Uncharacterized protein n=1 Tax=Linnemannia gamsii TaxID=64522 RepID=A0ABQ7K3B8_9FUNG|nr:hypothetical protein BGZ96_006269 [Linnemannia gamsii]